jgi:hypothetical protein
MRATELIRNILDLVDQVDNEETTDTSETASDYYDDETRRMNQIKDLTSSEQVTYSNSPAVATAYITAVTTDAGGGANGPKHPADIRADSVAMYPGAQHVR